MIAAPPPNKIATSSALSSSAHTLNFTNTDISHLKLMSCYFTMLSVTLFWLVTLTRYSQKPGCLAWCVTFTVISFVLASRLFSEQVKRTQTPLGYSASAESRSLVEAITAIYALTSFAICMAFVNTQWYKIDRSVLTQQVIDIELSPLVLNTADRVPLSPRPLHNISMAKNATVAAINPQVKLPAITTSLPVITSPPARLPAVTSHPAATSHPVKSPAITIPQAITSHPPKSQNIASISLPVATKLTSMPSTLHNNLPTVTSQSTNALPAANKTANSAVSRAGPKVSTGSSFFMEEVPPAQIVEVRETDNSRPAALHSPINSPSSAVNMSVLAEYLRDLHRVIKAAWTPPRDTSRSAEIIFRIKRSGQLALVKLVRSSGDVDADESAINAITLTAPFKPLPAAYQLASLDVDYTFNYTADKLTEVGSQYRQ